MTEALYECPFMKACSAQPYMRISANVQAYYEAYRSYVKELEIIIQKLVQEPSAEGDVLLDSYRNQQSVTHMRDTTAVEEFYHTALSQAESANTIFLFTTIHLESRHCNFKVNADSIMAA